MLRAEYHALRRAAYAAAHEYCAQVDSDGRSSYSSKSIMDAHALREAEAASLRVPHARTDLFFARTANRRRSVIKLLKQREYTRSLGPAFAFGLRRDARAVRDMLKPINQLWRDA